MVLLHNICQNSSGAVMTLGFGQVYWASCNSQSIFHLWVSCLECTAVSHETDLISHQLPQETLDTLFQSHLITTVISFSHLTGSFFVCVLYGDSLAQLVATLVGSTKLLYAGPG